MANAPLFEVISGLTPASGSPVWRRAVGREQVVDALKVDSGNYSFPNNTELQNGFLVREGEWLARQSDGKWGYAASSDPQALPVWLDPAVRFDGEGGIAVIFGLWVVKTNVIDTEDLAVQDELVVGALPEDHDVLPGGNGLVRLATKDADAYHFVRAVVEEILADGYVLISIASGYPRAGQA